VYGWKIAQITRAPVGFFMMAAMIFITNKEFNAVAADLNPRHHVSEGDLLQLFVEVLNSVTFFFCKITILYSL